MKTRLWITVLAVTLTLVAVSSAKPFVQGLVEKYGDLPAAAVVLGMTSCFMLLISVLMLFRTWPVRKSLVFVHAKVGTPNPVIARSVNLPQDAVAFLKDRSGGKHGSLSRKNFPAAVSDLSIPDHHTRSTITT